MSASDHLNEAQFHYPEYHSSRAMYPRHTPHSETRSATHVTKGRKGNVWKQKRKLGKH
jgi:hypothetical protein